jgi:hypothetical protein
VNDLQLIASKCKKGWRFWPSGIMAQGAIICELVLALTLPLCAQQQTDSKVDMSKTTRRIEDAAQFQAPAIQIPDSVERLTLGDRFHIYVHSVASLESVFEPAFAAGISQWGNEPPEWGQGVAGYGRRFASGYGRSFISHTIRFGFAALDGEDPRFLPSDEGGVWHRMRHAVVGTFVSRTESGSQMPAFSRFAGIYGAAFISNSWYPESRANTTHALERGSTTLASSIGWNIIREFWPDMRRAFQHK